MKYLASLTVIALAGFMFASCGGSGAAGAAQKTCDCAKPMVQMQADMKAAGDDTQKMQEIMSKYEDEGKKTEECMKGIQDKYKDKENDKKFQDDMMASMKDKCPDVYNMMMAGGGGDNGGGGSPQ